MNQFSGMIPLQRLREHALEILLVAVCCLAAIQGAAWTSSSVFERLPHTEDESAFLFQAQTIASGRLIADAPEEPASFAIPFIIVREGMWFGKYPPGYPAVLALGVLTGHPWLVNATFAALCVLLIYLLSRRLYGMRTAVLAALLLVVSPFFLLQAGSLLSHIVSLFWTLLILLLYPLARSQQGAFLPLAAGVAIGMLVITRPLTAVGVALPFIVWTLLTIVRRRRIHRAYILMLLAVLPFVAGYLAYNDLTTGSPFRTAYELWWPFDRIGFGPDIGINGHDLDDGLRNTKANANSMASYLFGWPGRTSLVPTFAIVLISLVTIAAHAYRRARASTSAPPASPVSAEGWDLILASVALSVVVVHIYYWTPGQMYGPRYFMEAVGPLVILSARCFERLGSALAAGMAAYVPRGWPTGPASGAAIATLLVGLTLYAYFVWVPDEFDRFQGWNDISGDGLAIVDAHDIQNALVFVQREYWTDYAPFFTRNTPALDSDIVYASDRGVVENARLMELYPQRSYYSFAGGELVQISGPQ